MKLFALLALLNGLLITTAHAQSDNKTVVENANNQDTLSTQKVHSDSNHATTIYPASETDSSHSIINPAPPAPENSVPEKRNLQGGINFGNHTGVGSDSSSTTKDKTGY